MTRYLSIIGLLLLLAGCGYFMSGSWDDDPDNWERAFYSHKPEKVKVVHSRYTRFPHWSDEFVYYFEINSNESFLKEVVKVNNLIEVDVQNHDDAFWPSRYEAPSWFLPKSNQQYKAWQTDNYSSNNFRVYQDKENGTIFLFDRVL